MPNITVYQYAGDVGVESASPFCVKIHRALAFKGLEYTIENVGSPGLMKRLNPGVLKVPVLDYDGEMVRDSSVILECLDERHPEPPLWPADPAERARARLLEDWADEALYWFAVYMRWAVDANFTPFAQRAFGKMPIPLRWFVPSLIRKTVRKQLHGQGLGRLPEARVLEIFEGHVAMLEGLLGGRSFLVGDALTVADLSAFAPLRGVAVESMPATRAIVLASEPVKAWLERVDGATSGPKTVPFA